eukprot:6179891-Pleurochrysis_carterae.AAC.5
MLAHGTSICTSKAKLCRNEPGCVGQKEKTSSLSPPGSTHTLGLPTWKGEGRLRGVGTPSAEPFDTADCAPPSVDGMSVAVHCTKRATEPAPGSRDARRSGHGLVVLFHRNSKENKPPRGDLQRKGSKSVCRTTHAEQRRKGRKLALLLTGTARCGHQLQARAVRHTG